MKTFALLMSILFAILGVVSIALALTSVMLFDSPGSENNTYLWVVFWAAISSPFACFGSVIASRWIAHKSQNYQRATAVFLVPCIVFAVMVISLVLIQIYCNGNFSCYK